MNYDYKGQAQLHYFGGYISISNALGDYIDKPQALRSYRVVRNVRVQVGTNQEIGKRVNIRERDAQGFAIDVDYSGAVDAPVQVIDVPIYQIHQEDVTPPFTPYGSPIKVGDSILIESGPYPMTGVLVELNDFCFAIQHKDGTDYIPWSELNGRIARN